MEGAHLPVRIAEISTSCSGINSGKSISRFDFFLHGVEYNCPKSIPLMAQANSDSMK
jgi:hypothetical protein